VTYDVEQVQERVELSEHLLHSDKETIQKLVSWVEDGTWRLPDFQRPMVWKPGDVVALLQSVINQHPAGSLIVTEIPSEPPFGIRPFEGARSASATATCVVLDGQQRLTSLLQALTGSGDYVYFLNLKLLSQGAQIDDDGIIFGLRATTRSGKDFKRRRELENPNVQRDELIYPLALTLSEPGYHSWSMSMAGGHEDGMEYLKFLNALCEKWIEPLRSYYFPFAQYDSKMSLEAVCTIFEDLNRSGVRLGVFDLLVARYFPHGVALNRLWEDSFAQNKEEFNRLEDPFDPLEVLKVISLTTTFRGLEGSSNQAESISTSNCGASATRKSVLELNASDIEDRWGRSIDAVARTSRFLHNHCGVSRPKWLSYSPAVSTIAGIAAWRDITGKGTPLEGEARFRIQRWYWASVFTGEFEQGAATKIGSNFAALERWLEDESSVPPVVGNFSARDLDLRAVKPGSAVYKGTMALIASKGPRDFMTAKLLSESFADQAVDDHHVFPKNYLGRSVEPALQNCILNRALIDRGTNLAIRDKAPSVYLGSFLENPDPSKQLTLRNLRNVLDSHFLPSGDDSPLWCDDFDEFLRRRESLLLSLIESAVENGE